MELLFPLIAILGLYRFFTDEKLSSAYRQKIVTYVSAGVAAFLLILIVFGKSLLGFHTDTEKQYLPPYLLDYLVGERYSMFRTDALKALLYVAVTAGVLFLSLKNRISHNAALVVIGLVSLFDLWSVNKRYLNDGNFVDATFATNPFITENSEFLSGKAAENPYIRGILSQSNVNKVLEEISEKDKTHYRIYNQVLGTFSETNTSYFKSSIGGYSAAKLRRYDDLINEYFQKMDTVKVPRILNMLNTKYMVFGDAENPQAVANPESNGNAWFVADVKFAANPNAEIAEIGNIDSKKTAVIGAGDKNYFEGKTLSADSAAQISLTKYQANEIEYKTQSKTPQLAVLSEIYYPHGWKMLLDGKEVPYIKANYLLRAVHVPAGNHTLKMVFEPAVIQTGKIISLAVFGLFLLLSAAGIWWLWGRYKRNQEPEEIAAE